MALHEQAVGLTNEWYTPPHVFSALGCRFDVDVASPGKAVTPWIPARDFLCGGSLEKPWKGYVWMNPPFGSRNGIAPWLRKFAEHGNGIALTPDRTSAPWWQWIAPRAEAILFVSPKIRFLDSSGNPGTSPAQGTCLMAIGDRGVNALHRGAHEGLGFLAFPSDTSLAAALGSVTGDVPEPTADDLPLFARAT